MHLPAKRKERGHHWYESMMTDNFIFCGKGKEKVNRKENVKKAQRPIRGHGGGRTNPLFCLPKRKTRPGGQPDGSSHMGAWGGWALAPNTAVGEG
jgi:hypothetical protein